MWGRPAGEAANMPSVASSGLVGLVRGTPFGGRRAFPGTECAVERVRILVTNKKRRFGNLDRGIDQVLPHQFMAGFVEQLPEGASLVGDAALERAVAHAEF